MRKSFYTLAAVAALAVMGLCAEKANAQYVTYSSGYGYAPSYYSNSYYVPSYSYGYAAPAYSYGYAPVYSYGYYRPSGVSISLGSGFGRGYGYGGYWGGYPGYGGFSRGYGSGYSVGVGPFTYSNYRFGGGRRWR